LKDIKRLIRNDGLDLSDLKGVSIMRYPLISAKADDVVKLLEPVNPLNHIMSSSQSSCRRQKRSLASTMNIRPTMNTINTKTIKSSGPYSRNFQQKLINDGVYPDEYEYPNDRVSLEPNNLEEINQILTQPRP
jgi:hypothetical protein